MLAVSWSDFTASFGPSLKARKGRITVPAQSVPTVMSRPHTYFLFTAKRDTFAGFLLALLPPSEIKAGNGPSDATHARRSPSLLWVHAVKN